MIFEKKMRENHEVKVFQIREVSIQNIVTT